MGWKDSRFAFGATQRAENVSTVAESAPDSPTPALDHIQIIVVR